MWQEWIRCSVRSNSALWWLRFALEIVNKNWNIVAWDLPHWRHCCWWNRFNGISVLWCYIIVDSCWGLFYFPTLRNWVHVFFQTFHMKLIFILHPKQHSLLAKTVFPRKLVYHFIDSRYKCPVRKATAKSSSPESNNTVAKVPRRPCLVILSLEPVPHMSSSLHVFLMIPEIWFLPRGWVRSHLLFCTLSFQMPCLKRSDDVVNSKRSFKYSQRSSKTLIYL